MSSYPEQLDKMLFDKVLHFVNITNLLTYDFNDGRNSFTGHQTLLYMGIKLMKIQTSKLNFL